MHPFDVNPQSDWASAFDAVVDDLQGLTDLERLHVLTEAMRFVLASFDADLDADDQEEDPLPPGLSPQAEATQRRIRAAAIRRQAGGRPHA